MIITKFESPGFAQPAVWSTGWAGVIGWAGWLAGWTGRAGWLTCTHAVMTIALFLDLLSRFPDFLDSGPPLFSPSSPIGVFPPPKSRKSGERLPGRVGRFIGVAQTLLKPMKINQHYHL